jgi:hypothetical protein
MTAWFLVKYGPRWSGTNQGSPFGHVVLANQTRDRSSHFIYCVINTILGYYACRTTKVVIRWAIITALHP